MLEELFGFGINVIIKNCKNSGSISSTYASSSVGTTIGIGGIIGSCYSDNNICDKINNCQNIAKINGKNCVGGIVGNINTQSTGYDIISNCSNTGAISGDENVGGILGCYERYGDVSIKSKIFNCSNSANISGKLRCGGILGSGYLNNTEVKNIYNIGNITGGDSLGGIIGESSMSSSSSTEKIKGEVCNFYNKGSIKATEKYVSGRIGGIVGSNTSEYIDFYNGYNATINISDILGYGAGIIAGQNMGNIANIYYLEITGKDVCFNQSGTIKAYKVTENDMRNSQAFVNKLGDRFCLDETNMNNGYPILIWMIDKIAPSLNIKYSEKEMTNENVVVTITANEKIQEVEGWVLSNDKKTLSKEYSENTIEKIVVSDLAENETQETIEIINIDNVLPELKVTYSTQSLTKENVTVTIISNEEVQAVQGWILSNDKKTLRKEYSANTKETITVKDLAGNEKQATIEIKNIDKTGPSVNVEYSTKNPTRENIIVTITSNEEVQAVQGWTLSNDKKTLTKEYSANTKEIITVKDLAGNEKQATIEIKNIDKIGPSVNVEYSTKNPTRENIIVTITSNEEIQSVTGWTLSSDKKTLTKEYSANTKETVNIKDLAGNEKQATIEIKNIDKTGPSVNVEYSTKNPTRENIIVTITSNEEIESITGWELLSDKKTLTKEYGANTKETVMVKDLIGNETQATIEINNIDKTAPTVNVGYSTKNPTKGNVKVTITSNEAVQSVTGWTLSNDKKTLTKEYSANTKETVTIKDLAGNEKQATIEIKNIDKIGPSVNVEYSTKNPTKENVIVTITSNEEIQSVTGWTLSSDKKTLTKEYSTNTKETITVKDMVGNETQATIEISNIDKTGLSVNVGYSTKNPTRENVIVTITSNKEVQAVQGWTLSSDKKTLTKEYSANIKETITIKDLAGNEVQANIEINNIDKTGPSVKVEYSTKNPTKENVKVTITSNEEIQSVTGWTLSSDKKTLTKEYSANTKETITVKDIAGNEAQTNIEINNIDKTAPTVNIVYSTKNPTRENVKVTITSNEEVQSVTGWTLSSDKKTLTKEYSANTKETITVKDLAGNETQANIEISNIDKNLPEITIGDINQDGKIDVTDFLMLKRHLVAGNRDSWKLTGDNLLSADMNENGTVDITDMLMLKKVLVDEM